MFKFLKIRTSESGDARRHVPFASIIHKHVFPLFVCFVFVFCHFCSLVSAFALADPQPQFDPIYDTDIVNFQNSYNSLNPGAQAAANIIFGAYLTEYAGLGDYGTVFDSVPSEGTIWDRLEFAGQQFVDTLFLPVNMADQLVLSPLIDLGQGIVNKVKGYNSVTGFESDVFNASYYGLSYTPDIGFSINQFLSRNGGLINWQNSPSSWSSSFQWRNVSLSGASLTDYQFYSTSLVNPVFSNPVQTQLSNLLVSGEYLPSSIDFLINPVTSNISVHTSLPVGVYSSYVCYLSQYDRVVSGSDLLLLSRLWGYNPSDYSTYNDVFQAMLNDFVNPILYFSSGSSLTASFNIAPLVGDVRYGTDWDSALPLENIVSLNFTDTDSLQYLNPTSDLLFDLKGLIQQLVNNTSSDNLEVPLQPVVYNITQVQGTGDSLTRADLEGLAFNVTPPQSGIDVPSTAFAPFFQDGGILSYFWYMTKPMVAFTRDVLDVFTFGPEGNFSQTGPGYFVLGAVALGLLGGVVVKFLL